MDTACPSIGPMDTCPSMVPRLDGDEAVAQSLLGPRHGLSHGATGIKPLGAPSTWDGDEAVAQSVSLLGPRRAVAPRAALSQLNAGTTVSDCKETCRRAVAPLAAPHPGVNYSSKIPRSAYPWSAYLCCAYLWSAYLWCACKVCISVVCVSGLHIVGDVVCISHETRDGTDGVESSKTAALTAWSQRNESAEWAAWN